MLTMTMRCERGVGGAVPPDGGAGAWAMAAGANAMATPIVATAARRVKFRVTVRDSSLLSATGREVGVPITDPGVAREGGCTASNRTGQCEPTSGVEWKK